MAILGAVEAITRLVENEERFDKFINEAGTYQTNTGEIVETVQTFKARIESDINATGAIAITESNKDLAVIAKNSAEAAAVSATASKETTVAAKVTTLAARDEAVALASGFASGIFGFTTRAAMLADLAHNAGVLAWVTNDSTAAYNGTYIKSGASGAGTWTQSSFDRVALVEGRILAVESSRGVGSGKNKFDSSKVTLGYEVYADGNVQVESQSVVSDFIYVKNQSFISVSGLQANAGSGRYFVFYAEDGVTITGTGNIDIGTNSKTIAVPSGSFWFRFSPKQRIAAAGDYATAQVEYGNEITSFESFGVTEILYIGSKRIYQPPVSFEYGLQKNKFDQYAVTSGYEVYGTGAVQVESNSVTSDFIPVTGQTTLTISGLQTNTGFNRYYVFLAENKTSVISVNYFTGNSVTIPIPSGAVWFRFSPKQRIADAADFDTVQVEYGSNATTYEAPLKTIQGINEIPIAFYQPPVSGWNGLSLLAFGDSITETATVLDDGTYTEGVRSNWPGFIGPLLNTTNVKSYAKSGASFKEYAGQLDWQKISHQVERAIAHSIPADVIVVAAGTNDGTADLGDYTTAMSRATLGDLDRSKTIEALRWALWTIKTGYPDAICFAVLPIQRADAETADRQTLLDAISKMAKRYNFIVIDAHSESGIVKDFEVWTSAGRYLSDGLHPNPAGQVLMANLVCTKIKDALNF